MHLWRLCMTTRPLHGVRILDLTNYFAGPFCTMILAGLGAEIIHVERPGIGNPIRINPPFIGPQGIGIEKRTPEDMSLLVLKRARNKKSITLDLRGPKGREIFLNLAKISNLGVENYSYGVMERMHLSYEELKKVNPAIIYCAITGFGHEGPYRDRVAYDIVAQAMSGFMDVTGFPDGPPTCAGIAVGDAIPGIFAAIGIISAQYHKKQTGQGQKVDISMQDCLFAMVFDEAFDVLKKLGLPIRTGNRFKRLAPYNSYKTKDGYIVLGIISDEQFESLLKTIGREDLIGHPRYDNRYKRLQQVDELDQIITEWSLKMTKKEAVEELIKNRVPSGPVMGIDELMEDPQLLARKMVVDLVHPKLDSVKAKGPGFPIKFSESPDDYDQPAPLLGQNNQEVYGGLLGMDDKTFQVLKEEKVIG